MIGAERQSGVCGVHDQMGETHQAKPLLIYNTVCMLTVKNPNNKLDKEELMRVCHHLKTIVGYTTVYYQWFEMGQQKQQHIHMIIKKKPPKPVDIEKYSKSFKQKKLKYVKYYGEAEEHNVNRLGDLVEYEIDTSQCNFKISSFMDQNHLNQCIFEYRFKELDVDFIDE